MVKLKDAEADLIIWLLERSIDAGCDGPFGNGDTITDAKGLKAANKLLERLMVERRPELRATLREVTGK